MDEWGEEGRNQMIEATNTLLERLEKETVMVRLGEDGNYYPIEPEEGMKNDRQVMTHDGGAVRSAARKRGDNPLLEGDARYGTKTVDMDRKEG
jgi:hypothetical protein